jgi:hypothetical protein
MITHGLGFMMKILMLLTGTGDGMMALGATYTNWGTGEGTNAVQFCAVMSNTDGKWHDVKCSGERYSNSASSIQVSENSDESSLVQPLYNKTTGEESLQYKWSVTGYACSYHAVASRPDYSTICPDLVPTSRGNTFDGTACIDGQRASLHSDKYDPQTGPFSCMCITPEANTQSWLQVDLGAPHVVTKLVIYGDTRSAFLDLLAAGYETAVGMSAIGSDHIRCYSGSALSTAVPIANDCDGIVGQYVRLTNKKTNSVI